MCLTNVDTKIKKHKQGYKIYKYDLKTKTFSPYYGYGTEHSYKLGVTYSAKVCSGEREIPLIASARGQELGLLLQHHLVLPLPGEYIAKFPHPYSHNFIVFSFIFLF